MLALEASMWLELRNGCWEQRKDEGLGAGQSPVWSGNGQNGEVLRSEANKKQQRDLVRHRILRGIKI